MESTLELLTPDEACRLLRMSKDTLYRRSSEGTIPKIKLHGKLLFRRADLEAWIEEHAVPARGEDA
jgi:excisionase family DNA binding protein